MYNILVLVYVRCEVLYCINRYTSRQTALANEDDDLIALDSYSTQLVCV